MSDQPKPTPSGTATSSADGVRAAFHLGQLRHLYAQMVNGRVSDTESAAKGLLSPAIAHFEQQSAAVEKTLAAAPSARCEDFHHAKNDRHGWGEPCPCVMRWAEAMSELCALHGETKGNTP